LRDVEFPSREVESAMSAANVDRFKILAERSSPLNLLDSLVHRTTSVVSRTNNKTIIIESSNAPNCPRNIKSAISELQFRARMFL